MTLRRVKKTTTITMTMSMTMSRRMTKMPALVQVAPKTMMGTRRGATTNAVAAVVAREHQLEEIEVTEEIEEIEETVETDRLRGHVGTTDGGAAAAEVVRATGTTR